VVFRTGVMLDIKTTKCLLEFRVASKELHKDVDIFLKLKSNSELLEFLRS